MTRREAGILIVLATTIVSPLAAQMTTAAEQASPTTCPTASFADSTGGRRDSSQTQPRGTASMRMGDSTERRSAVADHPTVVLFASASAREIRFAAQPRIVVRLCGAVTDSVHVIERRNLPDRVQPGTTYRDVYIAVEIIGHLNAECLAQRLGVSDRRAPTGACAALTVRDSTAAAPTRRPPPR